MSKRALESDDDSASESSDASSSQEESAMLSDEQLYKLQKQVRSDIPIGAAQFSTSPFMFLL